MPTVHIFSSCGRFVSLEALQEFVRPTYSEDGDRIDSAFMNEVGFTSFEPICIEAVHSDSAKPLRTLLAGASYWQQWLAQVDGLLDADSAICVFSPNVIMLLRSVSRIASIYECPDKTIASPLAVARKGRRSLLKPGRRYEDAVKTFEPYGSRERGKPRSALRRKRRFES